MGRRSGTSLEGRAANLALLVTSFVVSMLLAELVVRWTGAAPEVGVVEFRTFRLSENPKLGYEPVSGPETNALGYRDRDHAVEKPPGTYRIVVLGDSIAAGLFITDYENTFPALLESGLRQRDIDAEVINLSVNGYNTQQEVETLKDRGLQFSPDLVVLAFCVNDRRMSGNNVMLRLLQQESGGLRPTQRAIAWLERRSHLYRRLSHGLSPNRQPELPPPYESLTRDTAEQYFAELGRLQEEHGFRTLVVNFPFLGNLAKRQPKHWQKERQAAKRWSGEYGLDHLDLLPPLRRCEIETGARVYIDGLHPSVPGHECAAAATAQHIVAALSPPMPAGQEGAGP